MKKTVSVMLMLVLVICWCGAAAAEEKKKSAWYIGFGLGTGSLEVEEQTLDDYYEDNSYIDVGDEITLNFGVGAILNPKLHLGLDVSAIRQEVDSDISSESESYQVNNYFAALSYYPWTKGLFFKVGAGFSALVYEYDSGTYDDSETYGGTGYLVGLGYDLWLGKSFNLGIHVEYSQQKYNDSKAPDNTDFMSVYLSFYWF